MMFTLQKKIISKGWNFDYLHEINQSIMNNML